MTMAARYSSLTTQSQLQSGPSSLQQVVVKFAAANPIADGLGIVRFDFGTADEARQEPRDRLHHMVQFEVFDINVQLVHDGWGDPTGADFMPRELSLVEHHHIDAGLTQFPGTRGSGGSATND
jgi:hypothetical protein